MISFLPAVADPPALNRVNAGRVVPVACEIAGDPGRDILEGDRPVVRRVNCNTFAPMGSYEPAASPGASGLRRAGSTGRYTFPWTTDPSWAGTCRELALPLTDGSVHPAYFSFKSRPLAAERARVR